MTNETQTQKDEMMKTYMREDLLQNLPVTSVDRETVFTALAADYPSPLKEMAYVDAGGRVQAQGFLFRVAK